MKLLDLKEVSRRLGVHYTTARDFVLTGRIQGYRLAGRRKIQVQEADLLAFIEASAIGPFLGPNDRPKPLKMALLNQGQKRLKAAPNAWRKGFRRA